MVVVVQHHELLAAEERHLAVAELLGRLREGERDRRRRSTGSAHADPGQEVGEHAHPAGVGGYVVGRAVQVGLEHPLQLDLDLVQLGRRRATPALKSPAAPAQRVVEAGLGGRDPLARQVLDGEQHHGAELARGGRGLGVAFGQLEEEAPAGGAPVLAVPVGEPRGPQAVEPGGDRVLALGQLGRHPSDGARPVPLQPGERRESHRVGERLELSGVLEDDVADLVDPDGSRRSRRGPVGVAAGGADQAVERASAESATSTSGPNSSPSLGASKDGHEPRARLHGDRVGVVRLAGRHREVPGVHGDLVQRDEGGRVCGHLDGAGLGGALVRRGVAPRLGQGGQPVGDLRAPVVRQCRRRRRWGCLRRAAPPCGQRP